MFGCSCLRDPFWAQFYIYQIDYSTGQWPCFNLLAFCHSLLLCQPLSSHKKTKVVINGRNLKPLIRIAILNPIIYFICETIGIRMTTASESGAFLACIPVVALIMSSLI